MVFARLRSIVVVVVLGSAAAVGCMFGRRVDSSWAPLQEAGQLAAMKGTLAPEGELGGDLPRFAVQQQVLPSGLRVGIESGTARGSVTVVTVLGTGAAADPPEREGLAHLVEHLVYHAHAGGGRPVSDQLLRLGAEYNADTTLDTTRFYEVAPAGALPALLELAGERLLHPLAGVDEGDFQRERAIVENELNQKNELGVYGRVMAWIQGALFPPGHPYARPIGGSAATLRRLTLADARAFAAAHYRPDNASLLVTGEVGGRGALATVAARLPEGARGRGSAPRRPPPALPAAARERRPPDRAQEVPPDTLAAAVARPEIWLAYDLGGSLGPESAVQRVLSAAAAQSMVRERLMPEPEVRGVGFQVFEFRQTTLLACQIILEHDRRRVELARKAQNLVWALWSDSGPPAAVEWEGWRKETVGDIRQAALADTILGAEPFLERALERALFFHATGAVDSYDRLLGAIAAVRPADVSGEAYDRLAPERARTLFLEPVPEAERPAPGPVGVPSADNLPMEETPFRAADLGTPPRAPPPPGLREAKTVTLANGLTVVLVPRPQFPSVTALLGFRGGAAAMPAGVLELVRAIDPHHGGSRRATVLRVEPADGAGFTADVVHTDRRHLSNALFLLADRVKAVAETNWATLLARVQEHATPPAANPDDPRLAAAAKVRAALYGDHPYGRRVRARDLMALDPDLAPVWLPRLYSPRNALLVVAGDIDVEATERLVAGWFADWRGGRDVAPLAPPPVPPPAEAAAGGRARETVLVTARPVASQIEVTFACRLPFPASARELAAEEMAAGLLGGYLSTQIREQAGAAYSVASAVATMPNGGAHLVVAMSVDSRRARDALRILHAQVDALAAGRFERGALSQVRWSLIREATLRFQTGGELAEQLFGTLARGWPATTLAAEPDEVLRVGAPDLVRAFAPCAARPVLSLVGDEAAIAAALGDRAPRAVSEPPPRSR